MSDPIQLRIINMALFELGQEPVVDLTSGSLEQSMAATKLMRVIDDARDTVLSRHGWTCALEYTRRLALDLAEVIEPATIAVSGAATPIRTTLVLPLGLIANELVTNAAKHGARSISVEVTPAGSGLRLVVGDNGPGLPDDFDPGARKGLGMRVMQALVSQHGGEMAFGKDPAGGARFSVRLG